MGKVTAFGTVFAAALYASGPPTPDFAAVNEALIRFSTASVNFITTTFTPKKEAAAPVDAIAAANVDEDLDWHTAGQTKTEEAWRAFLAKHPQGAHAPEAQAELDKLAAPPPESFDPAPPLLKIVAVPLLTPPVVQVANTPARQPDVFAALEERPPPPQTIIKWKKAKTRTVVEWRYARPRYYQSGPQPFWMSWFGRSRRR